MEVAIIVVGSVIGAMSISAAVASICACQRFFSKKSTSSEDKAKIEIENEVQKKTHPDGTVEVVKKQKITLDRIDKDEAEHIVQTHQTVENKTANILAEGASSGIKNLVEKVGPGANTAASVVGDIATAAKDALTKKKEKKSKKEKKETLDEHANDSDHTKIDIGITPEIVALGENHLSNTDA